MSLTPSTPREIARASRAVTRGFAAKLSGRERGHDRAVHRESYDVHDSRAQVSQRLADGSEAATHAYVDALVKTAREYDLFERGKKKPRPLKDTGIVVLEALLRNHWHEFKTGRIDPAISQLMKATSYVRQTIVDALARLERHGFIGWVRRTIRISDPVPGGPIRQQTNNSYFVDEARIASRAGRNVRDRFRQLLARAKARMVLRAKQQPSAPPTVTPRPAPRPVPPSDLAAAVAALGAAFDRGSSPSLENGLSPPSE
ncbi:hypothetical protein ASE73_14910 [Sphingomonas sp. Leaf24]|uniref:hypothetical protein n=1 Tax=unclassified Sphingomonas TaxID=196159 RepID=UPI0006FFAC12|nr:MULTISPECIES: hypothetical protein [unclassified Sphingomonas]KQM21671.1 hypothetical protein ASE50_13130 [Sphingomonas sp. Leaf5]KQM93774.1 hypothetical protein ASE73_14910 [Sphingomonas sp. Leaf24]